MKFHSFKAIRNEVSKENLMSVAEKIASYQRHSGTPEERQAFEYLEAELKKLEYDTRLLDCDAYISLPVDCRLTVNLCDIPAQTHSMVPSGNVTGELIYVKDVEKCGHMSLKDKIVVTEGRAVFEPVKAAQDKNAIGIVFIQEAPLRECIPSACWGSPTPNEWDLIPTIPVASVEDTYGAKLIEDLKKGQQLIANLVTVTDTSWRKIPLLIADLKCPINTTRFVELTGHLDAWYYGAVDNGSSNSLMLEVARIAKKHQSDLRRNFRIVYFSGHSHGRYAGSAWYADYFWEDLRENCVVHTNTDCAGCKGADELRYSIIMPETKGLIVDILKDQTGVDFEGMRCVRNGDQSFWNVGLSNAFASFSRQKKVVDSDGNISYGKGNASLGPFWHTPKDLFDCIDPDFLVRDCKIIGEYVMTFLMEDVLPLDYTASTADIIAQLKQWDTIAGEEYDLSKQISHAERLDDLCRRFYQAPVSAEERNEVYLKLARILVPLNFTKGDIYTQEVAADIDPMPSLSSIREMIDPATPYRQKMALKLKLKRATNFIDDYISRAEKLLYSYL